MALNQIKSMYQTLRNFFTQVENDFGHMSDFGPYPYASIFGGEVCKFAYYMAAADGRLDERERLYINEITGYAESTQSMIDAMKQSGVVMADDRERFAQTPFKCLVIALLADSVYKEMGQDSNILKMTLSFFVLLGTDLMSVDGQISPKEQASLQAVVDTMQTVAESAFQENKQQMMKEQDTSDPAEEPESAPAVESQPEPESPAAEPQPAEESEPPAEEPQPEPESPAAEPQPAEESEPPAVEPQPEPESVADEPQPAKEPEPPADEPQPAKEPEPPADEPQPEPPVEESMDTEVTSNETDSNISSMSVEEIVAEVNGSEKSVDISMGLELSIGENGASYIAFHLSAEMRSLICAELADQDVPILLVGNTICASYDNHIVKKHLLNGVCNSRDITTEVVKSMNHSVSASASSNTAKIEGNAKLMEVINNILHISIDSAFANNLNDHLEAHKSCLRIMPNEAGEYTVRDNNQTIHSMEEVLWILSF